ncbi:ABC transporter permease [Streptomyces sp. AV19]|uniref:ABC transporter permease n=1 Tax=Streptomyces sp. AV19 TaxID=2793068 RepID=UPI0018FEC88D|nr:ABC transporter permease [Streptomyces sp. AV19]MBH1936136.1 ABC transporter permease [Streptomyces sp. AV19]MDG4534068.1 ABC transporter permease [Streptomyces sp. AV19]
MSALALAPRGLTWLVLRQRRGAVWTGLAALFVVVVQLVILRFAMVNVIERDGLGEGCTSAGCLNATDAFRSSYGDVLHYNGLLLQFLPLVIGMIVAGPMVARELESGTFKVVWTQSVTPVRWLLAQLAVPTAAVLAGVSLLAAVYTWTWSAVPDGVLPGQIWYQSFDMLGPAPVADALAGIGLGALAGLLVRRTVGAMGLVFVGHGLLGLGLGVLRPFLVAPWTQTTPELPGLSGDDSWRFERGIITRAGERIVDAQCDVGVDPVRCLAQHGADQWYLDYHPASHLWPLEWAEAGILVAVAVLAGTAAVRLVRRMQP